jgi:hypothetical protein
VFCEGENGHGDHHLLQRVKVGQEPIRSSWWNIELYSLIGMYNPHQRSTNSPRSRYANEGSSRSL